MKSNIITLLFLGLICLFATSCSSEKPLGPGEITGFQETYRYEIRDTVLSADTHSFTLSMIGDMQPRDWSVWDFKIWTGKELPDSLDRYMMEIVGPGQFITSDDGNTFGIDWITFEKVPTSTSPKLKISVKDNDSHEARAVMLMFGNQNGVLVDCGYVFIAQKALPDMEPFTMKIRYKGKVYSTQARLNIREEIEYDDPAFSRIMKEIDNLANVEALVMEDDLVDYFDMSDTKTYKAMAKLRQNIDPGTICNVRNDIFRTRANMDPYRFESPTSLGYYAMYDDSYFDDTYVTKNLYDMLEVADEKYMRDIGLNDKVSSLAVSYKGTNPNACAVLTVWEDSYYNFGDNDRTKHRISIVATSKNPQVSISKLQAIKCINSSNSWNDRISSYSFSFGNLDSYLKDY